MSSWIEGNGVSYLQTENAVSGEKPKSIDLKVDDDYSVEVSGRFVLVLVGGIQKGSVRIKNGFSYSHYSDAITRNNFGIKIKRVYIHFS